MYDTIVSLGYNCEISFRIEDYFGTLDSMPFSWSLVVNRDKFVEALLNPEEMLSGTVTLADNKMLSCDKTELRFHPRRSILPLYNYTEQQIEEAVKELKDRVAHLVDKYNSLCNSEKNTVFIIKVENKEDNKEYIEKVYKALKKRYLSGKFTLVVVMEKRAVTEDINSLASEHIKIYKLKKFAPPKYTNILGDVKGWRKLFYELLPDKEKKNMFMKNIHSRRKKWFFETVKRKLKFK